MVALMLYFRELLTKIAIFSRDRLAKLAIFPVTGRQNSRFFHDRFMKVIIHLTRSFDEFHDFFARPFDELLYCRNVLAKERFFPRLFDEIRDLSRSIV